MLKKIRHLTKKETGQALVEFALTLPVLLLLLCAIIDFGWFFSNQLSLSYCSREGARYGVVHAGDATAVQDITNRVLAVAPDYLEDEIIVTVTFSGGASPRSGDVTVLVQADIAALTPVPGIFIRGESISLSSQCVMKAE